MLLGNAQTFIGVLATLAVLCLFHGESNFLTSYLKHLNSEINEMLTRTINNLSKDVKEKFWTNQEQEDYSFFKSISGDNISLQQQLFKVVQDAQMVTMKFMAENEIIKKEANNKMLALEKAKEFGFIALYIFFFSLIILALDCCFTKLDLFGCIFLYNFIISSCVLLSFIWIHLWLRMRESYKIKERTRKKNKLLFSVKVSILFILLPSISLYLAALGHLHYPSYWRYILLTLLIYAFLFFLGGRKHFNYIKNTCDYNNHFILSHFVYLIIASTIVAGFYYLLQKGVALCGDSPFYAQSINDIYTTISPLKHILVFVIVANSILLPFVLSYVKYKYIKDKSHSTIDAKEKEALSKISTLKEEYNSIINKIKAAKTNCNTP